MRSRELENTDLPQRREGRGGTRRDFELLVSSVQFSEERVDLPRRREGAKGAEGRKVLWVKRNAELRRTRRKTGRERRRIGDLRFEMEDLPQRREGRGGTRRDFEL